MTKGEIAKENFVSGCNCAVSVALAFLTELGMEEEQLKKLCIGFGGGLARQRLTCGAVSGMAMALGALKSDGEDKKSIYALIQHACEDFKSETGSLVCGELLSGTGAESGGAPEARTAQYYKKRPCAELCRLAADITQKYIEKK